MTILKHNFSLHKLYGFLLLNTSLIVFMPAAAILVEITNRSNVPLQLIATMVLALSGIILSILFILKKTIAIKLLSALLIITILFVVFLMIQTLFALGEIGFTPGSSTMGVRSNIPTFTTGKPWELGPIFHYL